MKNRIWLLAVAVFMILSADLCAQIKIKKGETIAFLGDSITRYGETNPNGYLHLVMDGLKRAGVEAKYIPSGISGNRSIQMLMRMDKDVIEHKPEWMLLSCGVNDVWHGANGVPLPKYKQFVTQILDKAKAANIKVVIMTASMIQEDPLNDHNKKLVEYNDFLRRTAQERKLPLADINADMQREVKADRKTKGNKRTVDGVHMNDEGNRMMAATILTTLGVKPQQVKQYRQK